MGTGGQIDIVDPFEPHHGEPVVVRVTVSEALDLLSFHIPVGKPREDVLSLGVRPLSLLLLALDHESHVVALNLMSPKVSLELLHVHVHVHPGLIGLLASVVLLVEQFLMGFLGSPQHG